MAPQVSPERKDPPTVRGANQTPASSPQDCSGSQHAAPLSFDRLLHPAGVFEAIYRRFYGRCRQIFDGLLFRTRESAAHLVIRDALHRHQRALETLIKSGSFDFLTEPHQTSHGGPALTEPCTVAAALTHFLRLIAPGHSEYARRTSSIGGPLGAPVLQLEPLQRRKACQ